MSQLKITIRKMTEKDLQAAFAILGEWDMVPRTDIENAERSGIDILNSFVAETENGEIIGIASYIVHSTTYAETASLAVTKTFRGEGIGFKLQQARLEEMKMRGIKKVRTETDRPETIDWYIRKFGYKIAGKNPKKHQFSLPDIHEWTVLELDLAS